MLDNQDGLVFTKATKPAYLQEVCLLCACIGNRSMCANHACLPHERSDGKRGYYVKRKEGSAQTATGTATNESEVNG
jgi:hypothetical protein